MYIVEKASSNKHINTLTELGTNTLTYKFILKRKQFRKRRQINTSIHLQTQ
jgi:hypothetical protein